MNSLIKIIKCTLCDCEITPTTDSREHIIPQSIGGRLKVKGFICKCCNNKTGDSWDASLATQLNFFNLLYGTNRENGDAPTQRVEIIGRGEHIFRADGNYDIHKPVYTVTENGSISQLSIQAKNHKQLKQQLARAKKQFPKLDVDQAFNQAKAEYDFSPKIIKTNFESIDDQKSGRSIIKSCLALAAYHGIKPQSCSTGFNYLRNPEAKPCFGYFYERDLILNRPPDKVFHCVAITGNNETRQILGYVEYFVHRIVVVLSDNYEGQNFCHVYAIDPISANDMKVEINLILSDKDIEDIYNQNQLDDDSINKAFEQIMPIILANDNRKKNERIFDIAFKYALDNCGVKKDEFLTREHIKEFYQLFAEKYIQLGAVRRNHPNFCSSVM